MDLGELARRGRYVGAGQRRVVDEQPGRGLVTYTSVTVDGGQAVAGPSLAHLPVAAPANAAVTDTGSELVLTFTLPPGVTEAVVAGRRDGPPTGPDDPLAQTWSTTNTKLEIDGGLHVPAPPDGLGWYFSIHSVLRDGPSRLAAPAGLQLKARDSTPVTATYTVRRAGTFRRAVVIEVTASDKLPELVVRAKRSAVPDSADDGTEVGRMPGGSQTARLELAAQRAAAPRRPARVPRCRPARPRVHPHRPARADTPRSPLRPARTHRARLTAAGSARASRRRSGRRPRGPAGA